MWAILQQSFWRDEAFSMFLAQRPPSEIVAIAAQDQSPPLFFLLLHWWIQTFGTDEWVVRLLPFTGHVLLVIFTFLTVRKLIHQRLVVLFITFAVACNPFLVQYAFEVRPYSWLAMLIMASMCALLYERYVLASGALALAIATHNFALVHAFSLACWWLATEKPHTKVQISKTIKIFLLPGLVAIGFLGIIWQQWQRIDQDFWIPQVTANTIIQMIKLYSLGDVWYPEEGRVYLISSVLIAMAIGTWIWQKQHSTLLRPILWTAVISHGLVFAISLAARPIYQDRYLIATVPLFIITCGVLLFQAWLSSPKRWLVLVLSAFYVMLIPIAAKKVLTTSTKAPMRETVQAILAQSQPGDLIIPKEAKNFLELKWYARDNTKDVGVHVIENNGPIPFYLGTAVYQSGDVLLTIPSDRRVWQVSEDGSFQIL